MKKQLLLLFAFLCSIGMWADLTSPWTGQVVSSGTGKTTIDKTNDQFTLNNVTWNYVLGSEHGTPSETDNFTVVTDNSTPCFKIGNSSTVHWDKITFSTSAFSDYAVTEVQVYLRNNGKKAGTLTVKQGAVTIGTQTHSSTTNSWNTMTASGTEGKGGDLSVVYEVDQACYISSIKVTFTTLDAGKTEQTLTWTPNQNVFSVDLGNPFTAPTLNGAHTTVTYESSKPEVASVNATTGAVTVNAKGSTEITAKAASDATYARASLSYTLNVYDPSNIDVSWSAVSFTAGTPVGFDSDYNNNSIKDITATFTKETGSSAPAFSSSQARLYKNNRLVIVAETGFAIKSIVIKCSSASYMGTFSNATPDNTAFTQTWTSATPARSVTFDNTDNDAARITNIEVVYCVDNSTYIDAEDDINLLWDATSAQIDYQLTNGTWNNVTAATDADWISNFVYTEGRVSFTTTQNESTTNARTATVTLSYGNPATATKEVTVTQAKHIVTTNYTKVSASEMVIGGTYIWYGQKTDGTSKAVAGPLGSNTYFSAVALGEDSQLSGNTLALTTEEPEQYIFNQIADDKWTIADADNATKYLYVKGDKQLDWNTTKNEWTISGTDQPTFACSTYDNTAYTMYYNSGSTRFCAYTTISTNQNAILYHLASESAHTLSCVIDNETTKTYNIKDGYTWALLTPEKAGAVFLGWATAADGEVVYADGADYTMAAANATIYAKWRMQTEAPVIDTDLNTSYTYIKGGEAVSLSIEATDADSYQWYKNTTNSYVDAIAIDGATTASYTYTGTTIGTEYIFCAATNTIGTTKSVIAAIQTKGSNKALLSHIEFSNGFDAFIKNNKVIAYYMAGETAPSVVESSVVVSDDAIYEIDGNNITVLAEDAETMTEYTIELSPVTPTTTPAEEKTFDGTETWIKTGNAWEEAKGWKFSKNDPTEEGSPRVTDGRNRQYWFVGPATQFTLINTGVTTDRNIKVYVNGVEQTGITKIAKKTDSAAGSISITGLSSTNNNMIAVVSNQTGGDGGFTQYTLVPTIVNVTVNGCGNASFSCSKALDFTDVEGVKAYMVTGESEDAITLTEIKKVPANTGIFVLGTAGTHNIPVLNGAADDASSNKLTATTSPKTVDGSENIWALSKNDGKLHPVTSGTIAAGKAYLLSEHLVANGASQARGFIFSDDITTSINAVSTTANGVAYNLAGQRVAANTKGIVIVNGKKYVNK